MFWTLVFLQKYRDAFADRCHFATSQYPCLGVRGAKSQIVLDWLIYTKQVSGHVNYIRYSVSAISNLWFCCSVVHMRHLLYFCLSWKMDPPSVALPEVSSIFFLFFSQCGKIFLCWIECLRTEDFILLSSLPLMQCDCDFGRSRFDLGVKNWFSKSRKHKTTYACIISKFKNWCRSVLMDLISHWVHDASVIRRLVCKRLRIWI